MVSYIHVTKPLLATADKEPTTIHTQILQASEYRCVLGQHLNTTAIEEYVNVGFIYSESTIDTTQTDVCYASTPEASQTNLLRPLGVTRDCQYDSSGNPLSTTESVSNGCHQHQFRVALKIKDATTNSPYPYIAKSLYMKINLKEIQGFSIKPGFQIQVAHYIKDNERSVNINNTATHTEKCSTTEYAQDIHCDNYPAYCESSADVYKINVHGDGQFLSYEVTCETMFNQVFGKTWSVTEALLTTGTNTDVEFFMDPATNVKDLTLKPS